MCSMQSFGVALRRKSGNQMEFSQEVFNLEIAIFRTEQNKRVL